MEAVACQDCDTGDAATAFCATCSSYYCTVCAAAHCRRRASRDHEISPICGECDAKAVFSHCSTCSLSLCYVCAAAHSRQRTTREHAILAGFDAVGILHAQAAALAERRDETEPPAAASSRGAEHGAREESGRRGLWDPEVLPSACDGTREGRGSLRGGPAAGEQQAGGGAGQRVLGLARGEVAGMGGGASAGARSQQNACVARARAAHALGQSLAEEGRLEEALAQLLGASAEAEQALTLAKGNPRAGGDPTDERDLTSFLAGIHRDLGGVYCRRGELEAGASEFETAMALEAASAPPP
ncbi:hypothetical protein T484DRAFT_1889827, partial [Baffinella frigidus]